MLGRKAMKRKFKLLVFAVVVVAFVVPGILTAGQVEQARPAAVTLMLEDSFGREWELTYDSFDRTIRGFRDINDELGCGPAPAYGILGQGGQFAIATLDDPEDSCVTVYWEGFWAMGTGSGVFWNELGSTGTFTLSVVSVSSGYDAGVDPAQ
jgi:hypothetical protein